MLVAPPPSPPSPMLGPRNSHSRPPQKKRIVPRISLAAVPQLQSRPSFLDAYFYLFFSERAPQSRPTERPEDETTTLRNNRLTLGAPLLCPSAVASPALRPPCLVPAIAASSACIRDWLKRGKTRGRGLLCALSRGPAAISGHFPC